MVWRRADRFQVTLLFIFAFNFRLIDYVGFGAECSDCNAKPDNSVFAVASLIGVTFDGASNNCPW